MENASTNSACKVKHNNSPIISRSDKKGHHFLSTCEILKNRRMIKSTVKKQRNLDMSNYFKTVPSLEMVEN